MKPAKKKEQIISDSDTSLDKVISRDTSSSLELNVKPVADFKINAGGNSTSLKSSKTK